MNTIWRFFVDEQGQWRWQRLDSRRAVVSESTQSFEAYEACRASAQMRGYVVTQQEKPFPRMKHLNRR